MTHKEQIELILTKHPETKFNRAMFFQRYIQEYVIGWEAPYLTWDQFHKFWAEEAGVERALRDVLKQTAFQLPPEADAQRYKKANEFKEWKKKMPKEEQETFNTLFGK
jgi:hypothetical protein